jgi:hypothetical protein
MCPETFTKQQHGYTHNRDFYLAGMKQELMLKIHSNNIADLYQTKKSVVDKQYFTDILLCMHANFSFKIVNKHSGHW